MSPIRSCPNRAWVGTPNISVMPLFLLYEGATAVFFRPKGLVGRDGGADLVVVPRVLGLGRLLHLDEVRVVQLASVGADAPLAEERVVGRRVFHLGDHLGAVVALQGLHRLEI